MQFLNVEFVGKKYPHDKDNVQCCKHHRQKLTIFSESVIHTQCYKQRVPNELNKIYWPKLNIVHTER